MGSTIRRGPLESPIYFTSHFCYIFVHKIGNWGPLVSPKLLGPNINEPLIILGPLDLPCPVIAAMVKFRILGPPSLWGQRGNFKQPPPPPPPPRNATGDRQRILEIM